MERFAAFIVRFRWPILVVILVVTALFAVSMRDQEVRMDFLASMDPDDPAVRLYEYLSDTFGGNDVALIAVKSDDAFARDNLVAMRNLALEMETMEEVDSVLCLTEMLDIKKTDWGIEVGDLFESGEIPNQEELDALRGYILGKEMYTGIFVSPDGRISVLLARLKRDVDRVELGTQLRRMSEEAYKGLDVKLFFAGLPFQIQYMSETIMGDMGLLTPIVIALLALVLGLFYRRLSGVLLPLAGVGFAVVWSMGLMALTDTPISILTGVLPVILVAVGSAYAIHMVSRYLEERDETKDRREAVRRAVSHVGLAVIMTGLTTMVGFGSLASANIQIIRELGFFAAFGIFGATVIAIIFMPAVLAIIGGSVKKDVSVRIIVPGRVAHGTALFIEKNPRLISLGALVLFVAGLLALPYVKREVNLVEFFSEESTMRSSERVIEEHFGGSVPMQIYVQGDIRHPSVLRRMERIEKLMRSEVGRAAQSVGALLRELGQNLYGERRIPPTRAGVNELFYFIEGNDLLKNLSAKGAYYPPNAVNGFINTFLASSQTDPETAEEGLESEAVIISNVPSSQTKEMIAHTEVMENFLAIGVPRLESPVIVDDLDRSAFNDLRDYQLEWISWGLSRDSIYRGLELDQEKALNVLRDVGLREPARIAAGTITDVLTPWVENYVQNSGDVLLDDGDDLADLATAITSVWRPGGVLYPEIEDLSFTIESALPTSYLEKYPEDPSWLAEIISKRTSHLIQDHLVGVWTAEILDNLPREFSTDVELVTDLRGALYELTDPVVYLPSEMAYRLTGVAPTEIVPLLATQSGFPRIFGILEGDLVKNQITSIAIAYVLVLFLLLAILRNVAGGFMASIPILLAILINFAIMALSGIPLDLVTMMIASLIIGIGVDYTIHFTESFRRELKTNGNPAAALERVLATTGRSIIINVASVAAGFLVLLFSEVIPLRLFGVLVAVTMITSSLGALVVLPAIYFTFKPKFIFNKGLNPPVSKKEKR